MSFFYFSRELRRFLVFALLFTACTYPQTFANAAELFKCKESWFADEFTDTIFRVKDKYFCLSRTFEVLVGDNFQPICDKSQIGFLIKDDQAITNMVWAKDFKTTTSDTGVSCSFKIGIQLNYFFATEFTFSLDSLRLKNSWTSEPYKYETGTPNGEKVYPTRSTYECKKLN